MTRFYNYINEIFNTDINIQIESHFDDFFEASFNVDNKPISFIASQSIKIKDNYWEVAFVSTNIDDFDSIDLTGDMNQYEIFAGVIKSLKMFIKIYKPNVWFFSSKHNEKSRLKLYNRFQNIKISGYIKLSQQELLELEEMLDDSVKYFGFKRINNG